MDLEAFRFFGPGPTDKLVGREAARCLQASGVVVGIEEEAEVGAQFVVAAVVVTAHGGILQGAVHALDPTVGPRMVGPGEPVLDAVLLARVVEGVDALQARLAAGEMSWRRKQRCRLERVSAGMLDCNA